MAVQFRLGLRVEQKQIDDIECTGSADEGRAGELLQGFPQIIECNFEVLQLVLHFLWRNGIAVVKTAEQHRYTYRETFLPVYLVAVGDDKLHTATADVHNQHTLVRKRHGLFHTPVNERRFPVAGNRFRPDVRDFPHFIQEVWRVFGGTQGSCSESADVFRRHTCCIQLLPEFAQGVQAALKWRVADALYAFLGQFDVNFIFHQYFPASLSVAFNDEQVKRVGT